MKKMICVLLFCAVLLSLLSACGVLDTMGKETQTQPTAAATRATQEANDPAEELTLSEYTATIEVGGALQLIVTGAERVTWASTNDAVALVNSQGTVTGAGVGVVNITCTDENERQVSCTVTVTQAPTVATHAPYDLDSIFPHSSRAYLTKEEVATRISTCTGYSPGKSYAQDAINEIYARHGYVFKSEEVRSYYLTKAWYVQNPNFSEAELNQFEKENIKLLKDF